ncbi:MAG: DUF1015 domain-containing protein [Bryobacteraceae bacterium]|nr:DUF1015 domain-containing protein [Bryobacteraceae bacterium]
MAQISPFQPYRYTESAGRLDDLATQPYDKISPEMQKTYLAKSPYNLVRVILGERLDSDNDADNVYTRAAKHLEEWIGAGVVAKESEPSLYAYFQEFTHPETGERLTRKGFIGLGAVEEYSAGVVHRHEQTLSGPKKDRRQLLEVSRAHAGQIFMIYSDPECRVDSLLDEAAHQAPAVVVTDEYGTKHELHRIDDPVKLAAIRESMADKKLMIADGHHRYETALNFGNEHPELEDAKWVMMTFVNMSAPGLRILATHRVVNGLDSFEPETFFKKAGTRFSLSKFDTVDALAQLFEQPALDKIRIGVVHAGTEVAWLLERDREEGGLDVEILHSELLEGALGIDAEAVREQKFLKYVRGIDVAADLVADGKAQYAFLLEATTVEQVSSCAFNGRCMPQKSTDFYPKLLSGLAIYRLEK